MKRSAFPAVLALSLLSSVVCADEGVIHAARPDEVHVNGICLGRFVTGVDSRREMRYYLPQGVFTYGLVGSGKTIEVPEDSGVFAVSRALAERPLKDLFSGLSGGSGSEHQDLVLLAVAMHYMSDSGGARPNVYKAEEYLVESIRHNPLNIVPYLLLDRLHDAFRGASLSVQKKHVLAMIRALNLGEFNLFGLTKPTHIGGADDSPVDLDDIVRGLEPAGERVKSDWNDVLKQARKDDRQFRRDPRHDAYVRILSKLAKGVDTQAANLELMNTKLQDAFKKKKYPLVYAELHDILTRGSHERTVRELVVKNMIACLRLESKASRRRFNQMQASYLQADLVEEFLLKSGEAL